MAYLRTEQEKLEIAYPLEDIWQALSKAVETLEWTFLEKDDQAHKAKIKTKHGFMAYSSTLTVEANTVDKQTTRMSINAETPVTTITAMADFGRTRDRIDHLIETLAKQMENKKQP
ncbi:MAG: DUF3568 domain-containing protein [Candidatus Bathyarchaeota archaeon]|nr:DUF3568 domain-containing protein [Candidatus Bathyarchaeota archaeon]